MPAESDEVDCERCGETLERDDAYSLDGYLYCSGCHDDVQYEHEQEDDERPTEGVHSYGYKPNAVYFNSDGRPANHAGRITDDKGILRGLPYMGMEIEVEDPNNRYDHNDIVQEIHSRTNGLVYVKEDCSLSNGFEIVTHPMTIGYLQNHSDGLRSALSYLRTKGFRAWQTSTCGLHIHISKNSFVDAKHEMKFLYFVYMNKLNMIQFSGRNSSYAKYDMDAFVGASGMDWDDKDKPTIMEVVKGVRKNGDYVPSAYERNLAVNRNNSHTHELRLFRPSLRFETVLAYGEFVHCLWQFTQVVTSAQAIKEKGLREFEMFANYAREHNELYPNLVKKIHKRGVSPTPLGWLTEDNKESDGK
jgi:hypothetical protein